MWRLPYHRDQFDAIQARLTAHGVDFDGPVEILPGLYSIYFYDPNDIRLEACCELVEGAGQRVVDSVTQTKKWLSRSCEHSPIMQTG